MFEGFKSFRIRTSGAEIFGRMAGEGPPLLLVHGYPQSHVMWHKIAPRLAEHFTTICVDLRGYGDSSKPAITPDRAAYSKRAMAHDLVEVMQHLGHSRFYIAGHDRGGRATHRLALDHPDAVIKAAIIDIVPTLTVFESVNQAVAMDQYHWFFLAQDGGLPERMIGCDPDYYLESRLFQRLVRPQSFSDEALAEYRRIFRDPAAIAASCEDYRAAATIDLAHDRQDRARQLDIPLFVIWGAQSFNERTFDVLETWRTNFRNVSGQTVDCGHFIPEEMPDETYGLLTAFFREA